MNEFYQKDIISIKDFNKEKFSNYSINEYADSSITQRNTNLKLIKSTQLLDTFNILGYTCNNILVIEEYINNYTNANSENFRIDIRNYNRKKYYPHISLINDVEKNVNSAKNTHEIYSYDGIFEIKYNDSADNDFTALKIDENKNLHINGGINAGGVLNIGSDLRIAGNIYDALGNNLIEALNRNSFTGKYQINSPNIIFNQSGVAAHAEGAWILSCVARMGWLNRMTQFKEKAGKDKEKASVGLYSYPVLMAADILLYDATHVPVGDDQKQHLELCRDIAQKFNTDFEIENFLQVPEPLIQKEFSRIMSLKDGSKKMSKSELSDLSRINLTDDKDLIINKIKKAKTDPLPMPSTQKDLDERLEAKNLLGIYSSLTNSTLQKSVENFAGKNFSEFKQKLSEALVDKIQPISTEIKKLLDDKSYLDNTLLEGVERANIIASKKIKRIKEIVGF